MASLSISINKAFLWSYRLLLYDFNIFNSFSHHGTNLTQRYQYQGLFLCGKSSLQAPNNKAKNQSTEYQYLIKLKPATNSGVSFPQKRKKFRLQGGRDGRGGSNLRHRYDRHRAERRFQPDQRRNRGRIEQQVLQAPGRTALSTRPTKEPRTDLTMVAWPTTDQFWTEGPRQMKDWMDQMWFQKELH